MNITESRIVKKFGIRYVEVRFRGHPWTNWLFPMSITKKPDYVYVPELNVYRRKTSI